MANDSSLIAHVGAVLVGRDALRELPAPASQGPRHTPVPHIELVEALEAAAKDRGLGIRQERFALHRDGAQVFGVLDFHKIGAESDLHMPNGDGCWSLGFRGSNDRQMSLQAVAGRRVFVCDNLALSGDMIAMKRKHTRGLDLEAEAREAIDRYLVHAQRLDHQLDRLRNTTLHDDDAKRMIFDAFADRILPVTRFPKVAGNYFGATDETPDCQPRTHWGLHNSFTRVVRDMKPAAAFTATTKLGRFFGVGTQN